MNLLMVSPHLPHPSWGAGMRSYYLLKALAREHTVSLLALTGSGEVETHCEALAEMMHALRVVPRPPARRKRSQQLMSILRGGSYLLDSYSLREVQQELDAILARDHYDAVIFESVFMAGYRLSEDVPTIIDQHNIEYELLQRTYQRENEWSRKALLKPVELERCSKARIVLVTSERERLLLKQLLPRSIIEVVPNGVDTDVFDKVHMSQEIVDRIIFTGTMNYYPNIDAVLYFARECWPLILSQVPTATWQIVGKDPTPEVSNLAELPGITVTGSVPDVTCYLAAATVAIAPILIGGGTRLKILEALAMRKAVVSTSRGCEGLSMIPGKHLIVADQAQTFAQAVVDLMQDRERRKALGNAGRSLVEAEYSWERCGDEVVRALEKI
ncbi:MAG: glycosyltransferase [Chloroflexi bacterium]|nr:MAG: glycosyltransferase [Chloroflexota bacterium]